jgi:tryptophan synthase alpha chain
MSRITERFTRLRSSGRGAFIPYLTAGDPDLETTQKLLAALAEAGADIIELGVPFSDPMADGPIIQRASERALRHDIGIEEILPVVTDFKRNHDVPVVLFTYFNPLLRFHADSPAQRASALRESGVDGVLVTDLIPEEAGEFASEMRKAGIDTIFLVAPTSTDERIEKIARAASGFIYVVARTGVTGVRDSLSGEVKQLVERVRRNSALPVTVGFGISLPEHITEVWSYADGAVVGSRLVLEIERRVGSADLVDRVAALARELIGES